MANNLHIDITPAEFKELREAEKLHAIYKAILSHEPRICKLERRRLKDTGIAALSGTVAGLIGGIFRSKIL